MNADASPMRSDMLDTPEAGRRVVVGGAIRIVGYGAGLLAAVASAAIMTRHLGRVDYGWYGRITALVTIFQFATDLGLTNLGVREYSQRAGADRDHFVRVLLGVRIAMSTGLVAGATGLAAAFGYSGEHVLGTFLFGISACLASITATVSVPLQADIRVVTLTAIDLARQLLTAAAFAGLAFAGAGLTAFLAVSAPIYVAVLVAVVVAVRSSISFAPIFDLAAWHGLLRPTLIFGLASAVGAIYVYGAMVVTGFVTTAAETGDFAAAFRVFVILASFPVLIATTAFPVLSRAARDDSARLDYATRRLIEGCATLGGAAVVGLTLGAKPVIAIIAGPEYTRAASVLQIQGAALGITFVIAALTFTLLALHAHRELIVANLVALAVSATAVVVLGSEHGAIGASWGVLLGEATLCAGYLVALARRSTVAAHRSRAPRILLPVAAGVAVGLIGLPPVVSALLGLAVYGALAVLVGAIPDEVLRLLPWRRDPNTQTT